MCASLPLCSRLPLSPLENSPPEVLRNALHQSRTNERYYTLQSVWFKDDLQSFPSAVKNENLPRDKLRTHLQYSEDIKGFKLCIRIHRRCKKHKERFLSDVDISITEWEACELLWSWNQWQLSWYAATHAHAACLGVYLPVIRCRHKHHFCLFIHQLSQMFLSWSRWPFQFGLHV